MAALAQSLLFALSVTGPIFIMMGLGVLLKRVRLIDDHFIQVASTLVFRVCLPTLLFLSIQNASMPGADSLLIIGIALLVTLLFFLGLWFITPLLVKEHRDRGVFIQGCFRSNLGIIGLAFSARAFGNEGLALASMIMAFVTVLYNVLSVIALTHFLKASGERRLKSVFMGIFSNPLILAIALSFIIKSLGLSLPSVILEAGAYFASMTLPLALLCIGGTLSLRSLRKSVRLGLWASFMKLLVLPGCTLAMAIFFDVSGMRLAVLFLMVSAPTAAASYVMVEAMKGNGELAANIIAMSTVWSILTVSLGLFLLKSTGLV